MLQRIYDVTETTSYTFDQIGVLEKLDFIKIPKKCDLDIIRRHIFSLAYQWTLSTGSLYNSIFDYLGIPSRDCYDGHDISFILMSIDSLRPKCTDRMTKRSLYCLSIIYFQTNANDQSIGKYIKHLYLFLVILLIRILNIKFCL